jgi:DNA invertase Pin-like site-specific DNA recombinase
MRVALYTRVSTIDQNTENQAHELRRYCAARGWDIAEEYRDHGISGVKDRRPALDRMLADARRRRFDAVICWRLDRLGRNLAHLVRLLGELREIGVAFVSLGEGLDCSTAAGKLQMHILGALAEFERERIRERILAGLARARREGRRLGRRRERIATKDLLRTAELTISRAARALGVPRSRIYSERKRSPFLNPPRPMAAQLHTGTRESDAETPVLNL